MVSYNYDYFLALIIKRKTNLIIDYYLKKLKFYENYKKTVSFLIGCLTMITYSFRVYYINNYLLEKKGYNERNKVKLF